MTGLPDWVRNFTSALDTTMGLELLEVSPEKVVWQPEQWQAPAAVQVLSQPPHVMSVSLRVDWSDTDASL